MCSNISLKCEQSETPSTSLWVRPGRITNQLQPETTIHSHRVRVPDGMDWEPHAAQLPANPGGLKVIHLAV